MTKAQHLNYRKLLGHPGSVGPHVVHHFIIAMLSANPPPIPAYHRGWLVNCLQYTTLYTPIATPQTLPGSYTWQRYFFTSLLNSIATLIGKLKSKRYEGQQKAIIMKIQFNFKGCRRRKNEAEEETKLI